MSTPEQNIMLIHLLEDALHSLKNNSCQLSYESAFQLIDVMRELMSNNTNDDYISKEQACSLLGISRSTFDRRVKDSSIPQPVKRPGFKELAWKKSDILKSSY